MYKKLLYSLVSVLPMKRRVSDLEKIKTETLLEFNTMAVLPAFRKIASSLPFYKKILAEQGVNPSKIKTIEDFYARVPIIEKKDIFPRFKATDLCMNGKISDITSAIVTSGSSGNFAYGMLTDEDSVFQKKMIDEMLEYIFQVKSRPPLIINALSMGVTFSSSYPVITTGVRSDIALHLIKTLHSYYEQIIIITIPNLAKKMIDEGQSMGVNWEDVKVSFVVGGMASSSSMFQYMLKSINPSGNSSNIVEGTMGMTELGLNIFSTPSYLIEIRNIIQNNSEMMQEIFPNRRACPEIMYYFPISHHIEIVNPDDEGFGDIIISNIDTKAKTPLIRYKTGDLGKYIDRKKIENLLKKYGHGDICLKLNLPLMAIGGRASDKVQAGHVSIEEVHEAIYRDHDIANKITGHFRVINGENGPGAHIHLKKNVDWNKEMQEKLKKEIDQITQKDVEVTCIPYSDFDLDMDLNYENKWKHV